jgi:ankyrin repeat protein
VLTSKKPVKVDEIDKNGKNALLEAVVPGHSPDVVKALLAGKPKPKLDVKDPNGDTALILAVHSANAQGVDALIKAGANPAIKDAQGKTALDIANEFLKSSSMAEFPIIVGILQKVTPKAKPVPTPPQSPQPASP